MGVKVAGMKSLQSFRPEVVNITKEQYLEPQSLDDVQIRGLDRK
jgi:hypothetical protein